MWAWLGGTVVPRCERDVCAACVCAQVRAAALELLVQRSAARPLPLASTARALHQHGPLELRRLFWQRLLALADDHPDVRQLVDALPIELKSWHAQAHKG